MKSESALACATVKKDALADALLFFLFVCLRRQEIASIFICVDSTSFHPVA